MQPSIGTPFSETATRVLLCGSGELGKEVVIELQRLGCEVIAIDSYADAPAMQVADRAHAIDMLDGAALRSVLEQGYRLVILSSIAGGFSASPNADCPSSGTGGEW